MRKVIVFGRITIDISDLKSLEFAPSDHDDQKMARVYIEREGSASINPIKFQTNEEAETFYCRLRDEWIKLLEWKEDR